MGEAFRATLRLMRLIFGKLKELVQHKAPHDQLEYRLNRVFERAITGGEWSGTIQTVSLAARWGEVTLPRYYRTLKGVKVDGVVRDLTNRWWDYLPGKADAYGYSMEYVRDLGDGKPTLYSLPLGGRQYTSPPTATIAGDGSDATLNVEVKDGAITGLNVVDPGSGYTHATVSFSGGGGFGANAVVNLEGGQVAGVQLIVGGTLKLTYQGSETLKMTIYGSDKDWMPQALALQGNGATAANPFARIDRIHKEQGDVSMTLQHTSIDGIITPLTIMEPGEEETFYRRYIVDTLATKQTAIISGLCKLRHVELHNDQDIVPFSNIFAIEQGLTAMQYLAEGDVTLANQYWTEMMDALNDELKDTKAADEVATLRMHYPGNTQPKLSSTM
jgi:hypothetical protein